MAELRRDVRRVSEPDAPDTSGIARAYEAYGRAGEMILQTGAELIKHHNTVEEKTMLAGAKTQLNSLYAKYSADPDLGLESVQNFQKESSAIMDGWLQNSSGLYARSLTADMQSAATDLSGKLLGAAYKNVQRKERRDIGISIQELINSYSFNISTGDIAQAQKDHDSIAELVSAYAQKGASSKAIIAIDEKVRQVGFESAYKAMLKKAKTEAERTKIMQDMSKLPDTPALTAAFNSTYKEYTRLNALYKEGEDLTDGMVNIATGKQFLNINTSQSKANKLYDLVLKNILNNPEGAQQDPRAAALTNDFGLSQKSKTVLSPEEEAQFQEWYKGVAKKTGIAEDPDDPLHFYDYRGAYKAGAIPEIDSIDKKYHWPSEFKTDDHPNRFVDGIDTKYEVWPAITDDIVKNLESEQAFKPTIMQMAQAHAAVGAKNANQFPQAASNRLLGGDGASAVEAVEALTYVYNQNPSSLDLDDTTDILYSELKLMLDAGRVDFNEMVKEARNSVLTKSQTDLKANTEIFNSTYSLIGQKGLENLSKLFEEATGHDADKSPDALKDFYRIFKSKYLLSNQNVNSSLDATKRAMSLRHGADRFSPTSDSLVQSIARPLGEIASLFVPTLELATGLDKDKQQYRRNAPTKLLPGLTENQIQNQFLEQIVAASERIQNIRLPEHYMKIKEATDAEKMEKNLAFPAPSWSPELNKLDTAMYLTQYVEGIGDVEGRVFFKDSPITLQNDLGKPAWEVWMQDRMGREFPVIDNQSPFNNRLMVFGESAHEFAPEWAESQEEEELNKIIDDVLVKEGREIYPVWSLNPDTILSNKKYRKMYREEISNQQRVKSRVEEMLKGKPKEPQSIEDINALDAPEAINAPAAFKAINQAVSQVPGVTDGELRAIARLESSLDLDAKAETSTATGLFQVVNKTSGDIIDRLNGKKYGITKENIKEPYYNAIAGALYVRDIKRQLRKELGREPDLFEIYLGHFAGPRGAKRVLRAITKNPSASVLAGFTEKQVLANAELLTGHKKKELEENKTLMQKAKLAEAIAKIRAKVENARLKDKQA